METLFEPFLWPNRLYSTAHASIHPSSRSTFNHNYACHDNKMLNQGNIPINNSNEDSWNHDKPIQWLSWQASSESHRSRNHSTVLFTVFSKESTAAFVADELMLHRNGRPSISQLKCFVSKTMWFMKFQECEFITVVSHFCHEFVV